MKDKNTDVQNWALWRAALHKIRGREDYGYGLTIETPWLERELGCKRESNEFAFAMLELRGAMEEDDGYYFGALTITEEETGICKEVWVIPNAEEHENVCQRFERKLQRYSMRAVRLRNATLANPAAEMSDAARQKMDKNAEIAAMRSLLLKREQKVLKFIKQHDAKLLQG